MKANMLLIAGTLLAVSVMTVTAQGGYGRGQGQGHGSGGGRGPGRSELPPGLARHFDLDHDGTISKSEIREAGKALVKLDKNQDGQLSADEIGPAGSGNRAGQASGRGQGRRQGQGRGQGGPPAQAGQGNVLNLFDTDRNGTISAAEIKKAPASLARYDRNRDGQITADDFGPPAGRGGGGSGGGARRGGGGQRPR